MKVGGFFFFRDTHHFRYTIFKYKYVKKCATKLSIDLAIGERFSYIFFVEKTEFLLLFFKKFKIWDEGSLVFFLE